MNNRYLIFLALCLKLAFTNSSFNFGDSIQITVNKISPYSNPTESYRFYELPYCQPDQLYEVEQTFGEKLTGNRKMNSIYTAQFATDISKKKACERSYTNEELEMFRQYIKKNYLFEMFIEDIPVGGKIGVMIAERILMPNHLKFTIYYNPYKMQLIAANVDYQEKDLVDITIPMQTIISYTYTVEWKATNAENVINVSYNSVDLNNNEEHFLSLLNAFFLVILFVIITWRILSKADISQSKNHPLENENNDRSLDKNSENIWKTLRFEVFQCPPQINLLSASVGTGFHFIINWIIFSVMGVFGCYNHGKGTMVTSLLTVYVFTAPISGMLSSRIYKYFGATRWALNILIASSLFPLPAFIILLILNNFSWIMSTTTALSLSTLLSLLSLWIFIIVPLTIIGGITGRIKMKEILLADKGFKLLQNAIPRQPLYLRLIPLMMITGLITFSVMSINLDCVLKGFWGHMIYTNWSLSFLIFMIACVLVGCMSIIHTYAQLNSHDYRWWRSFVIAGSAAGYLFAYSIYFYLKKSAMTGFLQAAYFIGFMSMFCFIVFMVLGSVGFLTTMAFIHFMYDRSKVE